MLQCPGTDPNKWLALTESTANSFMLRDEVKVMGGNQKLTIEVFDWKWGVDIVNNNIQKWLLLKM